MSKRSSRLSESRDCLKPTDTTSLTRLTVFTKTIHAIPTDPLHSLHNKDVSLLYHMSPLDVTETEDLMNWSVFDANDEVVQYWLIISYERQ